MTADNSPTYKQGKADGRRDGRAIAKGNAPNGPNPPYPAHPVMYQRGYDEGLSEGMAEGQADEDTDEGSGAFNVDAAPFYA